MASRACVRCRQDLVCYLSGELESSLAAQVRAHLESCAGCREEAASIAGAIERVNRAAQAIPDPPEWLVTSAVTRARAQGATRAGGRNPWATAAGIRRRALTGAVVAAAFLILLSGQVGDRRAVRVPAPDARDTGPAPVEQNQMSLMRAAEEPRWVTAFTGDAAAAKEMAARLAEAGIDTRVRPTTAGESPGQEISVSPADLDRATQILAAARPQRD